MTEKEKEVIDRVLNYDTLSERYEADRSDKVKDGWNKYTSKVELKEYFSVWYQMLKKHPLVYAEATLNNYYYYLYPGKRLATNYSYSWSEKCMDSVNKRGNQLNMDVHYIISSAPRNFFKYSSSQSAISLSRWFVGSSRIRRSAVESSTLVSATRFLCPPERCSTFSSKS